MNRIIREFDHDHPGVRQKLNKLLRTEIKLYNKIGWPECLTNLSNTLVMKLIKIIVEGE